jgi:glutamyl-tRNA reductase
VERHVEATLHLFKEREIEIAFSSIPQKVKAIRETAVNEVFAKDLQNLDSKTREVVDNLLAYMEKKYNAVAMKTAKETWMDN